MRRYTRCLHYDNEQQSIVKMSRLYRARVEGLSHDGRGVVRLDAKVFFVPGALPGETIEFEEQRKRRGQFAGKLTNVERESPHRVVPECQYFGICGGCTLQHLSAEQQIDYKEKTLLDSLNRIGNVTPDNIMPPISGKTWNYRRKARPGVKFVPKKGGILIGFREQGTSFLTSLKHCKTLEKNLSALLGPLHDLVSNLSCYKQIPQIEFAAGDNAIALVMRHLQPLLQSDLDLLTQFAKRYEIQFFLQPKGLDSVHPLWPTNPEPLYYDLPDLNLRIEFSATDFVQVNGAVNQALVNSVLDFIEPGPEDRILDLFCGLGNFTLPMAAAGAEVLGVEGDRILVTKGRRNAELNRLKNINFREVDLFADSMLDLHLQPLEFTKLLLDPPRSGALKVVTELVPKILPRRIVYVSCNPATLARDSAILVHQHGYRLKYAGAIDMFPHTAHVESMGVFENAQD